MAQANVDYFEQYSPDQKRYLLVEKAEEVRERARAITIDELQRIDAVLAAQLTAFDHSSVEDHVVKGGELQEVVYSYQQSGRLINDYTAYWRAAAELMIKNIQVEWGQSATQLQESDQESAQFFIKALETMEGLPAEQAWPLINAAWEPLRKTITKIHR